MVKKVTLEKLQTNEEKVMSSSYGKDIALIKSILNKYPKNTDKEIVAMKIALIDVTNSTHLSQHRKYIILDELANIIVNIKNFDTLVKEGNTDIVKVIARCNGKVNLFSLASKYCKYHNSLIYGKDNYSIYDSRVKEALPLYQEGLSKYQIEKWRKEFKYEEFNKCIKEILSENNIPEEIDGRNLFDHYIWYKDNPNNKA